jgi:hypothetical protein
MASTLLTMPGQGWPHGRAVAMVAEYWHGVVDQALDDALARVEREQ